MEKLIIATRLRELSFGKLMEVYIEDNLENGRDHWPHEPEARQTALAEQDFYQYLREVFFPTPGAQYLIWEADGCYVSALRLQNYQDGLLLEALETHPGHRGRGFAKDLVRAVLETVEGQRVYSHISPRNGPSLAVHKACGFQKILSHSVYADGSVNSRCHTYRDEKPPR